MKLHVVFFTDRAMLPGLHAALSSLLCSNQNNDLHIHVFADGIREQDVADLQETAQRTGANVVLEINPYAPVAPVGANSLHGNVLTYGRIYIADLLPDIENCIYLDCDLLVCVDLADLEKASQSNQLLHADLDGVRSYSLDHQLFANAGLNLDGTCFNAGVLRIDLVQWRAQKALDSCLETAQKYSGQFLSADQSLLNVAFHNRVGRFGERFNTKLYPTADVLRHVDDRVYHFVGSPKPWDAFGKYLHPNYRFWHDEYLRTSIGKINPASYQSRKRILATAKSTIRAVRNRICG